VFGGIVVARRGNPGRYGHAQSVAVLDGKTGGSDCLPQALDHLQRLMAIELLKVSFDELRLPNIFHLICMLLSTALTPPTLRATSIALVASAWEVTKPLSRTVPLKVSTPIPLEFRAG